MPKKTQQKRRHSKKQKRTLKRNVKRTMRGGAIVHYRQISTMGPSPVYSENVNSVSNWISLWGEKYRGYDIEDGLTIHKIWQYIG